MGADTGDTSQQCRKLSDKHRTDSLWYSSSAAARGKGDSYYKCTNSGLAGSAAGSEKGGWRPNKVGSDAGDSYQKCRKLSDQHRADSFWYRAPATARKRGTPITNAQILAWQELSQEAKTRQAVA